MIFLQKNEMEWNDLSGVREERAKSVEMSVDSLSASPFSFSMTLACFL